MKTIPLSGKSGVGLFEGLKPLPGAQCSVTVYSGPHYGRVHKIIKRTDNGLVWVTYRGDTFAVPACDVEEIW